MKKNTYLQGAFILSLTNIITGIIALIYRIFLTKTIGAEGIGIYQLVLPLYYLFITFVSSGLVTTISKLVAENRVKKNYSNIYRIIKIGLILSGAWSILLALFISYNSNFLATYILKDIRTAYPILIFSPAIVFIALSAVLKGYFYGMEKVNIPASIDIVEKLIRLVILILVTKYFVSYGIILICAGAMLAMVCGEILSLILLFFIYSNKKVFVSPQARAQKDFSIIKSILVPLLPLSVSGAIENILDMIDAMLIPSKLVDAGFSKENALSLYGELTGMVIPILYFPLIIIASLSTTLIPSIAYSKASNNIIALNKKCNDSMTIASIIGFASAIIFISFPAELCKIFYNRPETGTLLFWSTFPCIFEYWLFIIIAILNGLGLQKKVMECSLSNILIVSGSIFFLMPIPKLNIYAYIIGFALSSTYVVFRGMYIIRKRTVITFNLTRIIVKPALCAIFMFVSIKSINNYLSAYYITKYNIISSFSVGIIIYFILLFISKTLHLKQFINVLNIKSFWN